MLVPFFNDVVGLLGALGFWPLTVFLPIQMHLKQAGMVPSHAHVFGLCHTGCLTAVACCTHIYCCAYTTLPAATAVHSSQTLPCHTIKFITLFAILSLPSVDSSMQCVAVLLLCFIAMAKMLAGSCGHSQHACNKCNCNTDPSGLVSSASKYNLEDNDWIGTLRRYWNLS